MALATKCPQCGALFRVVADQLKLRGGLVRCGQCRTVFDAIGSLTYVDDVAVAQARATPTETTAPDSIASAEEQAARQALGPSTTLRISPIPPATLARNLPPRTESFRLPVEEPAIVRRRERSTILGVHTELPDEPRAGTAPAHVPTLIRSSEPVVDDMGKAGEKDVQPVDEAPRERGAEADAPGVEATAVFTKPKRARPRGFSIVYGGGAALLVLFALLQLAVIFRGQVVIHWPESRSLLSDACTVFRCSVSWPTQPDQLAVIGTELQSIPGTDALELSAVIRNRAEFRQSLPALEVTLTDARNQALARKVFIPADYLASAGEPAGRLEEGLAPGGDLTIRIFFEARGLAPAGFLVYPFYL